MIILATVIILSLNSSDIIGKANEAKTSSDVANKKEAATALLSEYELELVLGQTTNTANEYVRNGLEAQGIDASDIAITEDGEILVGTAALFVNNNVQIGDTVKGYKLSQDASAKTYTTSGKENEYDEDWNYGEPQPVTIKRDENITWQYFGIDEGGKAIIAGSVTDASPYILLCGKSAYLNGVQEINAACDSMYTSGMGTARSIDIDDVTRVLEYTGEKSGYYADRWVPTSKPKTINEIAKEEGFDVSLLGTNTPDGSDVGAYSVNGFSIRKEDDAGKYNTDRADLIFPDRTNTKLKSWYWVASRAVELEISMKFPDYNAVFGVYYVGTNGGMYLNNHLYSTGFEDLFGEKIRPVVSLNDTVQMTYSNGVVTLK